MVDAAGAQEEQGFKEGMIEKVEDTDGHPARRQPQHHITQLADGGVGQHPLDIHGYQSHRGGKDGGKTTDNGDRVQSCGGMLK